MNCPAASSGVSEDRKVMIMPPHPDPLPPGEREQCCSAASSRAGYPLAGVGGSGSFAAGGGDVSPR